MFRNYNNYVYYAYIYTFIYFVLTLGNTSGTNSQALEWSLVQKCSVGAPRSTDTIIYPWFGAPKFLQRTLVSDCEKNADFELIFVMKLW